jgi:hypothetical protein
MHKGSNLASTRGIVYINSPRRIHYALKMRSIEISDEKLARNLDDISTSADENASDNKENPFTTTTYFPPV